MLSPSVTVTHAEQWNDDFAPFLVEVLFAFAVDSVDGDVGAVPVGNRDGERPAGLGAHVECPTTAVFGFCFRQHLARLSQHDFNSRAFRGPYKADRRETNGGLAAELRFVVM